MVSAVRSLLLHEPLAAGRFGVIYAGDLATETAPRAVAVKVLDPAWPDLQAAARRYAEMAPLLRLIGHRAVVRTEGVVRLDDRLAILLEMVNGASLAELAATASLPVRSTTAILGQVAGALHAGWSAKSSDGQPVQITHRGLTTDAILVSSSGHVKLLDFGLVKPGKVAPGASRRSPLEAGRAWLAPELVQGGAAAETPASDVYTLGAIAFEVLAGERFLHVAGDADAHTEAVVVAMQRLSAAVGSTGQALAHMVGTMLAHDPLVRPTPREVERQASLAFREAPGEDLPAWADQAVRAALSARAPVSGAELTGRRFEEVQPGRFRTAGEAIVEEDVTDPGREKEGPSPPPSSQVRPAERVAPRPVASAQAAAPGTRADGPSGFDMEDAPTRIQRSPFYEPGPVEVTDPGAPRRPIPRISASQPPTDEVDARVPAPAADAKRAPEAQPPAVQMPPPAIRPAPAPVPAARTRRRLNPTVFAGLLFGPAVVVVSAWFFFGRGEEAPAPAPAPPPAAAPTVAVEEEELAPGIAVELPPSGGEAPVEGTAPPEAEEAAAKKAAEEEKARKAADAEKARKAADAEKARKAADEEKARKVAATKAANEDKARKAAAKKAADAEAARAAKEAAAKKKAEAAAAARAAAEEKAKAAAAVKAAEPKVAETATVRVGGDAKSVVLVRGGSRRSPGEVPAGSYGIEADFGAGPVSAGNVELSAGSEVTITCRARFTLCTAQ